MHHHHPNYRRPQNENSDEQLAAQVTFASKDPADRLPPLARAKLISLREHLADSRALARRVYDDMGETRRKAEIVDIRIRDLTQRQNYADDYPLVLAEKKSLQAFKADMSARAADHASRSAAATALRQLVENLEKYSALVSPQTPMAPALRATATSIDQIRSSLAALAADLEEVRNAPITAAAAKRIAREHIERLAELGRPDIYGTLEGRRPPTFITMAARSIIVRNIDDGTSGVSSLPDQTDVDATLAWLFKDQIIAALEREIDAAADDESGLEDDERAKRAAALRSKILATERAEEAFIEAAAKSGVTILRRPEADPRAILGLADTAPELRR